MGGGRDGEAGGGGGDEEKGCVREDRDWKPRGGWDGVGMGLGMCGAEGGERWDRSIQA